MNPVKACMVSGLMDYKYSSIKDYMNEIVDKMCIRDRRREDISREIAPIYNEVLDFDSTPVIYHEIETNGIGSVSYTHLVWHRHRSPAYGRCNIWT